jgi:V/A-type H+-transporting ATPase subunit I
MFQAERMKKVSILAIERDIDPLIMGLGELGAIHLTPPSKESDGALLAPSDRREDLQRLQTLSYRIERAAAILRVALDLTEPSAPEHFAAPEEVASTLEELEPEIDGLVQSQQELTEEAADLRRIVDQVHGFEGTPLLPSRLGEYSFVHFALGTIPAEKLQKVGGEVGERVLLVPFRDLGDQRRVLAITTKKGRWALDSALQKHGFRPEEVKDVLPGLPDEVLASARLRLAQVIQEDESIRKTLDGLAVSEGSRLRQYWRQLAVRQRIVRAHENFGRTESTYLVSGWVPVTRVERFVNTCLELTEHRAIIEIHDPEEMPGGEEPPTSLKHSWLVRPFALVVAGYGFPRYGEIEPTVLVAISFFLMFGAMFGDVGQGAVLLLAGLGVWRWSKKEQAKDFGMLIALCGVSAMLFGLAYGAVFGKEGVIHALWGTPMKEVLTLLKISVVVGIVVISLGVVLNILNKVRSGDWAAALFDRFGIAGIAFYWGALGLAVKYMLDGKVSAGWAAVAVLVPLALIFLKEPVRFALVRGGLKAPARKARAPADEHEEKGVSHLLPVGPEGACAQKAPDPFSFVAGFFIAVIEGLVEVLEALLLYTSNTASFMRLGAYALAHAGLCLVIFELGKAVAKSPGGAVWSVVLVVVGNVVVIVLEGLVVAVQTLRLEYYEFFGKFLSGEGKAYKPFDLKSEGS